ncbi:YbaB/EbfC family nucleoid-associated protein [Ruania zhangjianzhongii]|uniref:YbaB/EbfC family nucleoid-associated protein n=1 Tax=Ruania zhangjianzhongii TaxID=2603206 RepID=UPI0011C8EFE7|nr:YbaB/EbfC family nucleoid-associated protein [Ruania zhangjianzhongii]
MADIFQSPEEAQAQIDQFREMAQKRGAAAERAVARMEEFSVEAWSTRREVRVALDSKGLVADLEFAEWAPTESPMTLSRAVQKAHDDALRKWKEGMDTIADEEYADAEELRVATKAAVQEAMPVDLDDEESE